MATETAIADTSAEITAVETVPEGNATSTKKATVRTVTGADSATARTKDDECGHGLFTLFCRAC